MHTNLLIRLLFCKKEISQKPPCRSEMNKRSPFLFCSILKMLAIVAITVVITGIITGCGGSEVKPMTMATCAWDDYVCHYQNQKDVVEKECTSFLASRLKYDHTIIDPLKLSGVEMDESSNISAFSLIGLYQVQNGFSATRTTEATCTYWVDSGWMQATIGDHYIHNADALF